ncbi:unnamed protein product [Prunus armeniaca]|uniref:Uncharacterized protein n=1 Tax=Prunus armeniaca TaxID=36596 RepID=A0A6J5XGQ3_PRUAR|nr:hypothetical protein GBA52_021219 [Prunus armeniaca]CAB4312859.1 unnamed protein product [Prunus armeniaca]
MDIARWRQDIHHLRDDFEKAFLEGEKALTKFDVHWKDIKKDISKVLEQSEDQNKNKHLEKQLQKMGKEPERGFNETAAEPGSLILDGSVVSSLEDIQDILGLGNGENLIPEPSPSQTPEEAAGPESVQATTGQEIGIPTNEIFEPITAPEQATDTNYGQKVPEQATISEEDRVLLQLSSAKQLLQLWDETHASNAAKQAEQTLRTWLSRDLETFSAEENFGELKEALEVLHAQNLFPEQLLNRLRKMFNYFDAHIAENIQEKQELHDCTRFLTDHEQDLVKIKHGVEICQACEAELEDYDSKIGRVKAELAALEQGRAGVMKKIQGVMGGVEPVKRKLEQESSQADQVRAKRFRLEIKVGRINGLWLAIRKAVNNYFNF